MSAKRKIAISFAVLLVIGMVGFVGFKMIEADVKSQYQPVDQNNPCRISGSTFDTLAQSKACDAYLNAKNQRQSSLENSLKIPVNQVPTEKKISMPSVNSLQIQMENMERKPNCEYIDNVIQRIEIAMNTGGIQYTQQHKDLLSDFQELKQNACK